MKLRELWQSFISLIKRENPITPRFVFWYIIGIIIFTMLIVAVKVIPMVQRTIRLNQDIQQGKIYIRGQNPFLNPDIDDFILEYDGTFQLEKFYPLRIPQAQWGQAEIQEYWDDIDQKKLKDLREDNLHMLEQQLEALP